MFFLKGCIFGSSNKQCDAFFIQACDLNPVNPYFRLCGQGLDLSERSIWASMNMCTHVTVFMLLSHSKAQVSKYQNKIFTLARNIQLWAIHERTRLIKGFTEN